MTYARISGTGSYLPENIMTNHDLEKIVDTSDQWIRERTGIEQRHIAAEGETTVDLKRLLGDYVIYRRDAVPAYHLAVVIDDNAQGVTTIVRGSDLLRASAVHLHLGSLLGFPPAHYVHVPVLMHTSGEKMSKQRGAARVDMRNPSALGAQILELLGSPPPEELVGAPPAELWQWAVVSWRCDRLRGKLAVIAER